jgi:redox-sensitive bicupin YhaK (pirin superfamily)
VNLYATVLGAGESVPLSIEPGRHLWVQVLRGEAEVNGHRLSAGDGLAASDETAFTFGAGSAEAELLVFDLA